MHTQIADNAAIDAPYVSAGHLPPEQLVKALVVEAYDRLKSNIEEFADLPALVEVASLMRPRNRIGASENVTCTKGGGNAKGFVGDSGDSGDRAVREFQCICCANEWRGDRAGVHEFRHAGSTLALG
jgi:hypothetical protein